MAIKTEAGNPVLFLGLPKSTREDLLRAILGNKTNGIITVNAARKCYLALSSTDPETTVTEPTDANYVRVKISGATSSSSTDWSSDYLTFDGATATNTGIQKEIKFNRSLDAWASTYPYFVLFDSKTGGNVLAWGKLKEPIIVNAKNVVPLFEEGKFRLHFPAPSEVETLVNNAAESDAEPVENA